MKYCHRLVCGLILSLLTTVFPLPQASALTYTNSNLDVMLCFRQVGSANPFDLEVNLGSVTNLIALPMNTSIPLTNYNLLQLSNAMGSSAFDNTEFSVLACTFASNATQLAVSVDTIFATIPRSDPATPNDPWTRETKTLTSGAASPIYSIGELAGNYSGIHPADPLVNSTYVVGIGPGNAYSCEGYLGTSADLNGSYFIVENVAFSPFNSPIVSDFFMEVPKNFADPLNGGATTGLTDYLGYFTFSPDGSLTFTRASTTIVVGPPPQPTLQISRTADTSTISFATTNGATYTLIYTNFSGLSAARSSWPTLGSPIIGSGGVTNFTDSEVTPGRVYSVTAH